MEQQIMDLFPEDSLGRIYLPIHSVDGIKCDVIIKKSRIGLFKLCIETRKSAVMEEDEMCEHNYFCELMDISDLKALKTTLDSLRFDRTKSMFTQKPIMDWSFLASETVKLKYDTCCVCMEITTDKTNCGHTLCVPCYDKIETDDEEGTLCPLCRQGCFYK